MSEPRPRRPEWLKIQLRTDERFRELRGMVDELRLNTVCVEARCPNIYECWNAGTATFMILGDTCTRFCGFCNVNSGKPAAGTDRGANQPTPRATNSTAPMPSENPFTLTCPAR